MNAGRDHALRRAAYDDLATELVLATRSKGRPAVVVEGTRDYQLFRKFLPETSCALRPAGDKKKALEVVRKVSALGVSAVAIVDADEEHIEGPPPRSDCPCVLTDSRDLESMMFLSGAGDSFIHEHLREAEVRRVESTNDAAIKKLITRVLAFPGAVRTINAKRRLGLRFSTLDVSAYVDLRGFDFNRPRYLADLCRSAERKIDEHRVMREAKTLLESQPAERLLHGHDLSTVLSAMTRGAYRNYRELDADEVESSLRLAYSRDDFSRSQLFQSLRAWGKDHNLVL